MQDRIGDRQSGSAFMRMRKCGGRLRRAPPRGLRVELTSQSRDLETGPAFGLPFDGRYSLMRQGLAYLVHAHFAKRSVQAAYAYVCQSCEVLEDVDRET